MGATVAKSEALDEFLCEDTRELLGKEGIYGKIIEIVLNKDFIAYKKFDESHFDKFTLLVAKKGSPELKGIDKFCSFEKIIVMYSGFGTDKDGIYLKIRDPNPASGTSSNITRLREEQIKSITSYKSAKIYEILE